jgi:hypothetical protein
LSPGCSISISLVVSVPSSKSSCLGASRNSGLSFRHTQRHTIRANPVKGQRAAPLLGQVLTLLKANLAASENLLDFNLDSLPVITIIVIALAPPKIAAKNVSS